MVNLLLDSRMALRAVTDPLDRLLVAQAQTEPLRLPTQDPLLSAQGSMVQRA